VHKPVNRAFHETKVPKWRNTDFKVSVRLFFGWPQKPGVAGR
jgi:hypothetical protein